MLGWRLKPFIIGRGFNTLEHGFRSNGGAKKNAKPGGVLAVGSSFTAGSDVVDGAVAGATARAHRLECEQRRSRGLPSRSDRFTWRTAVAAYSSASVGRRFDTGHHHRHRLRLVWLAETALTIENSELVVHNLPFCTTNRSITLGLISGSLSAISLSSIDFMAALFADFWFTADGNSFVTVSTDEVGVTCRLLQRLKQKAERMLRLVLHSRIRRLGGETAAVERSSGQRRP